MELRDALTQISQIRQQVAQTEVFRGYRAQRAISNPVSADNSGIGHDSMGATASMQVSKRDSDVQMARYLKGTAAPS